MAARSTNELLEKVLRLPVEDRARVAREVIASLDGEPADAGAEQAWAAEVTRRARDVLEGRVELEDGDQVLKELRAELESQRRGKISPTSGRASRAAGRGRVVRGTRGPRR